MGTRQIRNQDQSSTEFSINEALTEHNSQFAIIVNTIENGKEETHNLLRDLIEELKQQSEVNLQINGKTINAIEERTSKSVN